MRNSAPISSILIGSRTRRDLGDVQALADTITKVGLFHDIVIDSQSHLIAGLRRLEACKLLGWDTVPVKVIDLDSIATGELIENTCRKDYLPSEIAAISKALRPRVEENARKRRVGKLKRGQKAPEQENALDGEPGQTRDLVARYAGISGRTLEKIEAVVQAAEEDPATFGPLLAEMDAEPRAVDRCYRKLQLLRSQTDADKVLNSESEPAVGCQTDPLPDDGEVEVAEDEVDQASPVLQDDDAAEETVAQVVDEPVAEKSMTQGEPPFPSPLPEPFHLIPDLTTAWAMASPNQRKQFLARFHLKTDKYRGCPSYLKLSNEVRERLADTPIRYDEALCQKFILASESCSATQLNAADRIHKGEPAGTTTDIARLFSDEAKDEPTVKQAVRHLCQIFRPEEVVESLPIPRDEIILELMLAGLLKWANKVTNTLVDTYGLYQLEEVRKLVGQAYEGLHCLLDRFEEDPEE